MKDFIPIDYYKNKIKQLEEYNMNIFGIDKSNPNSNNPNFDPISQIDPANVPQSSQDPNPNNKKPKIHRNENGETAKQLRG